MTTVDRSHTGATTMNITTNTLPSHSAKTLSPKSVMHHAANPGVDRFVLGGSHTGTGDQQYKIDKSNDRFHSYQGEMPNSGVGKRKYMDGVPVSTQECEPWSITPSKKCKQTHNPVEPIVDQVTKRIRPASLRQDHKAPLSLASGDAIAVGNMPTCSAAVEVVVRAALENPHAANYADACGTNEARSAVARHHSFLGKRIGPENVIIANGCSGALYLALNSLLDAGSILLVPQPGFPLYEEIARSIGAQVIHYHLDPQNNWECDIDYLESIMSSHCNVRALVINNPSSATGAVFSEDHLSSIAKFAEAYRLPILADEIYGDLTFGHNQFFPMAQVAAMLGDNVPVITASGISKQFLLPGWRVGWLTFHDNKFHSLSQVLEGAKRLAQLNHGASSLAQAAIPTLLNPRTPGLAHWKETLRNSLQERNQLLCNKLSRCPGLKVISAQGGMHATIELNPSKLSVEHDLEFAMRLVDEENVFVVPGTAMGVQNILRVSFCYPENVLCAAASRIESFCFRHAKSSKPPPPPMGQ